MSEARLSSYVQRPPARLQVAVGSVAPLLRGDLGGFCRLRQNPTGVAFSARGVDSFPAGIAAVCHNAVVAEDVDWDFVHEWLRRDKPSGGRSDHGRYAAPEPAPTGPDLVVAIWERKQRTDLRARRKAFLLRPETSDLAQFDLWMLEESASTAIRESPENHLLLDAWLVAARESKADHDRRARRRSLAPSWGSVSYSGVSRSEGTWIGGVWCVSSSRLCRVCKLVPDERGQCECGDPTIR